MKSLIFLFHGSLKVHIESMSLKCPTHKKTCTLISMPKIIVIVQFYYKVFFFYTCWSSMKISKRLTSTSIPAFSINIWENLCTNCLYHPFKDVKQDIVFIWPWFCYKTLIHSRSRYIDQLQGIFKIIIPLYVPTL